MSSGDRHPQNFIQALIAQDNAAGTYGGRVQTRFPPEPNGYLHIGHAKAICVNFGLALEHGGACNLRMDDTNPSKEEDEYVHAIQDDVRWLGFDWGPRLFYASDYFEQLFEYALKLIRRGVAYVCDLTSEQMREYRGTLTAPGRPSPNRDRSVAENLDLFQRMRAGEFADASRTLRAKIDMASPNVNLRDPVLYRIMRATHHRTGDTWCIYPLYDFAHGQSDSIEGITHSLCTLEFENHRPLYDWFIQQLGIHHPKQIEFARLNISYTLMSKRKLLRLVREGVVHGWDDPRMPTLSGLRRRGFTPESIRNFCREIGVAKFNSVVEFVLLENALREDLNKRAARAMVVLRPLKLVIENYLEGATEELEAANNPEDPTSGKRRVPFGRELWIEHDDFRETPPPDFHRLAPGQEVRLRYAYIIQCTSVRKDPATGAVIEVRCQYDPATKSGAATGSRKVKSAIHWVPVRAAVDAEVRLYEQLFAKADPEDVPEGEDFLVNLNPRSLETLTNVKLEPVLRGAPVGSRYQFERHGYFCVDPDTTATRLVFNRTVALKDSWAKIEKAQQKNKK
ncbi:MAG: glutamine--tRNA ligase/YqeY domain fusion protein [Planctomycetota bacterium]